MKNFITFVIFCNLVHCADSNIKIEKGKLWVRYKGSDYKNTEEIIIDKNKEIDIDFIKDLVKNKKLKDNKEHLKLDEKGNYEIKMYDKNKKDKYKIADFKTVDLKTGNFKSYYIKIQKYYILPKGSKISIDGYSADLEGQKVYLDDFNFNSQTTFIDSVFKKFKSLKLRNYLNNEISLEGYNGVDYYLNDQFFKDFKGENNKPNRMKFKEILDGKTVLNIDCKKCKIYIIESLKLDGDLERKFKISKDLKKTIKTVKLRFEGCVARDQIVLALKKYIPQLNRADVNNKSGYFAIDDDKLNIVITDLLDGKGKDIVPKSAKINIGSEENIFIIDKEKYKSKRLYFNTDKINTKTVINEYIDKTYIAKTYPELKGHYDLKVEGDKDGKFEDGTKITITIKDIIENVTTAKNPDKIYVKINFEVSDKTKYKLKENILELNDKELELKKGSKYENLIETVKKELGNIAFKDGFVVLFNDSNFTTGDLTNNGTYIFKLCDSDTNFVVGNIIDVQKDDSKKDDDNKEDDKDDDNKDDNKDEIKMSKYKPSDKGKNKPDIGGDKPKGKCRCCCCN